MPRRARIVAAGYPMHVILRGIAVFETELDARLLQRLRESTIASGVVRDAYPTTPCSTLHPKPMA